MKDWREEVIELLECAIGLQEVNKRQEIKAQSFINTCSSGCEKTQIPCNSPIVDTFGRQIEDF